MAIKKVVSKKKSAKKKKVVSKKKSAKKKVAKKKRVRSKLILAKAQNEIDDDDIVYVNGTGKPANGRPPKSAKLSQIRALASIGCTMQEMAAIVGMNKDSFTNLKKNNPAVKEIIDTGRAEGCGSLRRKQHEVALRGDTVMLKWLGKNRLKQFDRAVVLKETSPGDEVKNELLNSDALTDDELAAIATQDSDNRDE